MFIYLIIFVFAYWVLTLQSLHTSRPAGPGCGAAVVRLTWQVAALDASQVRVDPEQLPHLVVDGQSDGFPQTAEEQNLALRPVQRRPLDLWGALQQVGEVHVPAEPSGEQQQQGSEWFSGSCCFPLSTSADFIPQPHNDPEITAPREACNYCSKQAARHRRAATGFKSFTRTRINNENKLLRFKTGAEQLESSWEESIKPWGGFQSWSSARLLEPLQTTESKLRLPAQNQSTLVPEYSVNRVLWYQITLLEDYFTKDCPSAGTSPPISLSLHPSLYLSSISPRMYMKNWTENQLRLPGCIVVSTAFNHWASNSDLSDYTIGRKLYKPSAV